MGTILTISDNEWTIGTKPTVSKPLAEADPKGAL